jgi:hypothetical protein
MLFVRERGIRYLALGSLLPIIGVAACRIGGDSSMNMPPPAATPTQTNGAPSASAVDPNVHMAVPSSPAMGSMGMPGMATNDAGIVPRAAGGMSMDAGQQMSTAVHKGGMAPMGAGMRMGAMQDGGMKPGGPMPMRPTPPAHPMPMGPEHGNGPM